MAGQMSFVAAAQTGCMTATGMHSVMRYAVSMAREPVSVDSIAMRAERVA